ncbi:right-handed parallel beta-helix repeat-containing protein [Methanobrevibacter sp.]|uniref:right-handed parallel beta-helix repeat-containing protein n=1 Tax=Methanobrevibacter sp. TaxID=66852 RepID=UPI00386CF644
MVNKKILISCLLILLVAISVSAVSAADDVADVAAGDDSSLSAGKIIHVDGDDDVAVSNAMASAEDGDIIDLGNTGYTFNKGIEVTKRLTFAGEDAVIYANGSNMPDGVFEVMADGSGTAFSGISFINVDDGDNYLYKYNGMIDAKGKSVKTSVGIAIDLYSGANNVMIDNCIFQDWFNNAIGVNSANYATIRNSQFYGGSATFINNIPDGPKDRGTYHISVMSSRGTTVDGCLFAGQVCDGVSVAGGSYDSTIINNIFELNAFSIYFGGKSTEGTLIKNNTFINCGWFVSPVYGPEGETGETVDFQDLPVISVQKSSDSFVITNNTFYARNANVLIKALEGSTAHGGESNIGNITITDNVVLGLDKYDIGAEKVILASVDLVYIETYNDVIRPTGEIIIANNILNGARAASYWTQKWGDDKGDVSIKTAEVPTTIAITSLRDSTIKGSLKDFYGKAIAGETISYTSADANGTVETEFDGSFVIKGVSEIVDLAFAESGIYLGTTATVDVAPGTPVYPAFIVVEDLFVDYTSVVLQAVLINDETGDVIRDAPVTFEVNGNTYDSVTDQTGKATTDLTGLAPGTYTAAVSYAGDKGFTPFNTTFEVEVSKVKTVIDAYYDAENNQIVATLINDATGKGIKGGTVGFVINKVKTLVKSGNGGKAVLSLEGYDLTSFKVSVSYGGNTKYFGSVRAVFGAVNKTATEASAYYDKETGEIVATVTNVATGNFIKGATVGIEINGVKNIVKTDANGEARVAITDLGAGAYTVTSSYSGNTKYSGTSETVTLVKSTYDCEDL